MWDGGGPAATERTRSGLGAVEGGRVGYPVALTALDHASGEAADGGRHPRPMVDIEGIERRQFKADTD